MHRTRIKFCGITRPQDTIAAATAGADAIGLVFYEKSPRFVSMERAINIVRALPPMVSPVALFVDSSAEEIRSTAGALNIRTVQLHGEEPPEILAELDGFTVIKAIRSEPKNLLAAMQSWHEAFTKSKLVANLLLDTCGENQPGGTGVENDWTGIESVLRSKRSTPLHPIIAAGGLTPENVGSVIRRLRPWAVDVSSGIEESPGIKSDDKMRRFAEQVGKADITGNNE